MADGENATFRSDPLAYIQAKPVDHQWMDKRAKGEMYSGAPPAYDSTLQRLGQETWFQVRAQTQLDLVKRNVRGHEVRVLRFARTAFSDEDKRRLGDPLYEAFYKTRSGAPLEGYWFPYLSPPNAAESIRGGWGIASMGQVDFPKQNPALDFVFTGAMNGCALVVCESPVRDHWRIYHYPNADTYPQWKEANTWPATRRYVWTVQEYGTADEPTAWNFLRYDRTDNRWYLHCQPHAWGKDGLPFKVQTRRKVVRGAVLPGRIRLDELRNVFPDAYL